MSVFTSSFYEFIVLTRSLFHPQEENTTRQANALQICKNEDLDELYQLCQESSRNLNDMSFLHFYKELEQGRVNLCSHTNPDGAYYGSDNDCNNDGDDENYRKYANDGETIDEKLDGDDNDNDQSDEAALVEEVAAGDELVEDQIMRLRQEKGHYDPANFSLSDGQKEEKEEEEEEEKKEQEEILRKKVEMRNEDHQLYDDGSISDDNSSSNNNNDHKKRSLITPPRRSKPVSRKRKLDSPSALVTFSSSSSSLVPSTSLPFSFPPPPPLSSSLPTHSVAPLPTTTTATQLPSLPLAVDTLVTASSALSSTPPPAKKQQVEHKEEDISEVLMQAHMVCGNEMLSNCQTNMTNSTISSDIVVVPDPKTDSKPPVVHAVLVGSPNHFFQGDC